jgi:Ser/Thr protein kinase RdoA (MazF antagonist)
MDLLTLTNRSYPLPIESLTLHRDLIGRVFLASSGSGQYILKVYRPFHTENAQQAAAIFQYLHSQGYPVPALIPTCSGELCMTVPTPTGPAAAILSEYIDGSEPCLDGTLEQVARQAGWLHRLMQAYPGPRRRLGREFYLDRFIEILRQKDYPPERIAELDACGRSLWQRMEGLPPGFCHGDLHTGNLRQAPDGRFFLFDFDVASHTTPAIDAATLSNASHFNCFDDQALDRTRRQFDRFYHSYSQEASLSAAEMRALYAFIALRHCELIATITECQGLDGLSRTFLDQQHDWILRWADLCARAGVG